MKNSKLQILIVSNNDYAFVKRDIELLSTDYNIKYIKYNYKNILQHIKIINNIINSNLIVCWLAHYYSYFVILYSKILNKKVIIIPGGDEIANIPKYKYGAMTNKKRYYAVKFSLKHSDCIIPVNEDIKNNIIKYYGNMNCIKVIHTAPDPRKWTFFDSDMKYPNIITVSNINSIKRYYIKGIDRFIDLANSLPEYKFILIGMSIELGKKYPNNLRVYCSLPHSKLRELYATSKVYCQLSRSEGTPNTVCEAMLSGCIPVCTNIGGMSHLCNKVGFLIDDYNIDNAKNMILKALKDDKAQCARKYILDNYSSEYRRKTLKTIIENTINK